MILMLFIGASMQLILAGGISFTSAFPKENYTTLFFTGAAFSGILCTLLLILLLTIFGSSRETIDKTTMIFFGIVLLSFISVLKLTSAFSKTEYSKNHLGKIEKIDDVELADFFSQDNVSSAGSRITDYNHSEISEEDMNFSIKQIKVKEVPV